MFRKTFYSLLIARYSLLFSTRLYFLPATFTLQYPPMRLKTFGGVVLEGSSFTRIKPLILLSYLAVEGSKDRRYLSEFFWSGASDGLNSLSRALSQFRKDAPGAIEADEQRVWTTVESDVQEFLNAIEAKNFSQAVDLYQGPFLDGAYLQDWGEELEEWIYQTREDLATRAQESLLQLAEDDAARGRFAESSKNAERAFELPGATAPEPETLSRYYALLIAGNSPLAARVKEEADSYGISLQLKSDEAKGKLQSTFVGRDKERVKLESLSKGQWAWVSGAAGMGKTALLKSLSGTYLQARSGLPYATLEPLLGTSLESGEELMLRKLSKLEGVYIFDPWEWMDEESQKLLRRLRDVKPEAKIILGSREGAAFRVDTEIELSSLTEKDLQRFQGAWARTEGLPALVGAFLRGEPLEEALEARLDALPKGYDQIYLAMALLENPDPALVRRALGLKASVMSKAYETLMATGLIASNGKAFAYQAAVDYLETHRVLASELALKLARELSELEAFPLYSRAKLLWEDEDFPSVRNTYAAWANELLRRGFPQRASEVLQEAPKGAEITFLRSRALERAGLFKEALKELENLQETPEVLALKGALYWRLGKPEEARSASERALDGEMEARAEALNTLGALSRSEGNVTEAVSFARKAAALWRSLSQNARWVDALNNLAIAKTLLGQPALETFEEALLASSDSVSLKSRTLLNIGWMWERNGNNRNAKEFYEKAANAAQEAGVIETAAFAWNNMGVLFHLEGAKKEAISFYEKALLLAQQAGERRILGMAMANIAELSGDVDAWQEALRILEESGHKEEADQYRTDLPLDHPFREQELHINGNGN
jgi:tetratricopeptide (TPR) repeat protein